MLARLPDWTVTRAMRYLVAWWVLSVVVVFAAWAVGWPLAMAVSMVRQGLV